MLVKYADLSESARRQVKRRYIYRRLAIGNGKAYASDAAWFDDHAFYVRNDGLLDNRYKHCEPQFLAS